MQAWVFSKALQVIPLGSQGCKPMVGHLKAFLLIYYLDQVLVSSAPSSSRACLCWTKECLLHVIYVGPSPIFWNGRDYPNTGDRLCKHAGASPASTSPRFQDMHLRLLQWQGTISRPLCIPSTTYLPFGCPPYLKIPFCPIDNVKLNIKHGKSNLSNKGWFLSLYFQNAAS